MLTVRTVLCLSWSIPWLAAGPAGAAATEPLPADVEVYPQVTLHEVSPHFLGVDLDARTDRALLTDPGFIEQVKRLGIRVIRFPGPCVADRYAWQDSRPDELTIDEFIAFAEAVDAEPLYILNMQGGTHGLTEAPPPDAPLAERIRARHVGPDFCGSSDYHFGTLAEAVALVHKHTVQRVAAGKRGLSLFQMGSVNWVQAKGDWPPEVYTATCEAYAQAMLTAITDYQEQQGKELNVLLSFVVQGYPMAGGEPPPAPAADPAMNLAWTAQLNRLAEGGVVDAVHELFFAPDFARGGLAATAGEAARLLVLRQGNPEAAAEETEAAATKYRLPVQMSIWETACPASSQAASRPAGADQAKRQVQNVELLRSLLERPTGITGYASLLPGAGCAGSGGKAAPKLAAAVQFLGGWIGEQVVRSEVRMPGWNLSTEPESQLNGAARPPPVAALGVAATRRDDEVFVVLVNRTADQPVRAQLYLRGSQLKPEAEIRTLPSDGPGRATGVETAKARAANPLVHTVAPSSAQVVRLSLARVVEVPLTISRARLERSVRAWVDVDGDRFQISTLAAEPIRYQLRTDADWLIVQPALGALSIHQPQEIQVSYATRGLGAGTYEATITVDAPDAYNSPQTIHVTLTLRGPRADFDRDGDVDQADMTRFEVCMMATPELQATRACSPARLDGDQDVDLEDYQLLLTCMSGPDAPPGPECVE